MDDLELLCQYATHGSEAAFETLVQRHVNVIYFAALLEIATDTKVAVRKVIAIRPFLAGYAIRFFSSPATNEHSVMACLLF